MQYINRITSNAFLFKATFNTVVVALGPISHLFCIGGGAECSVLSTSKKKKRQPQMTLVLNEIKVMKNRNFHA